MNVPKAEATVTYYSEICANIRQIKNLQWQVVIVAVALLAAVPAVPPLGTTDSSSLNYLAIAKVVFCIIAVFYAILHVHRYQLWLTKERQSRNDLELLLYNSGSLLKKPDSMHPEKVSYWFDSWAFVSWWLVILCTGVLSMLIVLFSVE